MKKFPILLALLTLSTALSAQFVQFGGASNGQKGVMFAVDNISAGPVVITSLDVKFLAAGTANVEVYAANGSFVGNESNVAFWGAPVATATGLAHVAGTAGLPGNLTPLGLTLAIPVAAASRASLWVTCTAATASNVFYTSGVGQYNATIATDGVLNLIGGVGKTYPLPGTTFGLPTAGRLFNGRVNYMPAGPPVYDTNTAGCSLDVNGLQGNGFAPTNSLHCVGSQVNINLGTNQAPMLFELAYNLAALVPLGGGGLPAGTLGIVNLDLSATTLFLNGGAAPLALPSPGPFTLGFPMPAVPAPGISAQYVQFSAASPDGFEISQAINIQSVAIGSTVLGPVGDDSAVTLVAGAATTPNCVAIPSLSLYGNSFTTYHVTTNGRMTFGGAQNTSFTPTAVYGLTETPFIGCHTDFIQGVGSSVTITINPTSVLVNYNTIPYFGQPTTMSSYGIEVFNTGAAVISNINLGTPTAIRNVFLGVHPGGAAPIDAGFPTTYVGGGTFVGTAGASQGIFADVFAAAITSANQNLNYAYNGFGYTVTY